MKFYFFDFSNFFQFKNFFRYIKMNSENNLLYNNKYIEENSINRMDVSSEKNEQFKRYYLEKLKNDYNKKLAQELQNPVQEINPQDLFSTNPQDLLSTNFFGNPYNTPIQNNTQRLITNVPDEFLPYDLQRNMQTNAMESRKKRRRITVFNVDSRDRNTSEYPNANTFKIQLDREYVNIKQVALVSTEFPNTDRIIKATPASLQNNRIVWINEEDSGLAVPFPEYSIELTDGNYTVSTLTKEMKTKMDLVKRSSAGNTKNHYFDISINLDTDIVEIHSLNLTGLENNPIAVTEDSNLINVYVQDALGASTPTWAVGDKIFLNGVKGFVGGITPNKLNGFHTVTKTTLDDGTGLAYGPIAINESNYIIDFDESGTSIFAALTKQVYSTPSALATEISSKMTAASVSSITYTADFDSTSADKFTIAGTGAFSLLFSSGANIAQSTATTLGFASTDVGPNTTFTAGNNLTLNNIEFEISIEAVYTARSGGNGVRAGNVLPFKFLFSEGTDFTNDDFKSTTIAGVLGYPEEDSSVDLPGTNQLSTTSVGISNVTIGNNTSITTDAVHNLNIGDKVQITGLVTIPSIIKNTDGIFEVITVPSTTEFTIGYATNIVNSTSFSTARVNSNKIIVSHTSHSLVTDDIVAFYRSEDVGGLLGKIINGTYRRIKVIDANSYSVETEDIYATSSETGGGTLIRISAHFNNAVNTISNTLYGFNGLQDNTSDGTNINKSVNLDGENYVLLTSPQLGTFSTSGLINNAKKIKVENVFAKLLLTGAPGTIIFNSYISSPKIFDKALYPKLTELQFTVQRQDSEKYDFFGRDYSFGLEISEIIDEISGSSYSARRGTKEFINETNLNEN